MYLFSFIRDKVSKTSKEILEDEAARTAATDAARQKASESIGMAQRFVRTFANEIKNDFGSSGNKKK